MGQISSLTCFLSRQQAAAADGQYRGTLCCDRPMSELTSFRIGGNAAALLFPADIPSLCTAVSLSRSCALPFFLLGGASNVLCPDEGIFGAVIMTRKLQKISFFGKKVVAECGCPLNSLILSCAARGLGGMEGLYGIPGTVGGAVFMNAGACGTEIADRLLAAEVYSTTEGRTLFLTKRELGFSYRTSILQHHPELLLLRAIFAPLPMQEEEVRARIRALNQRRRETQPLSCPSAGSAFRRPDGETEVWRLIDRCGLRGYRIGGAAISEKHAGFIVNCGGATAKDVRELIGEVISRVEGECGVRLVPEIRIL